MPGGSPTILIIEDEEKIVDVLRAYLERDGYSVLTAADILRRYYQQPARAVNEFPEARKTPA